MEAVLPQPWFAAAQEPDSDRGWGRTLYIVGLASLFAVSFVAEVGGGLVNIGGSDPLILLGCIWLGWRFVTDSVRLPLVWLCLLNFAAMAAPTIYNHELSMRVLGTTGILIWMLKTPFLWAHFYVLVNLLRNRSDLMLWMRTWVIAAALNGVVGIYGSLAFQWFDLDTPYALFFRARGLMHDCNAFAMYLSVSFFIGWALIKMTDRRPWWLPLAMGVHLAGMVLTSSRGAMLAVTICLGLWWLLGSSLKFKTWTLGAVGATILLLLLLPNRDQLLASNPVTERLTTTTVNMSSPEAQQRKELWGQAADEFLRSPVFGIGRGNYGQLRPFAPSGTMQAHNVYLGLLGEIGLLGAATWVLLGLYFSWTLIRRSPLLDDDSTWPAALMMLCAMGVVVLTGITINTENERTLWLLMASLEVFRRSYTAEEPELVRRGADW